MKVINLEYGHRCRADPVEAAIYSLEAKGEELEMFRANASAELTVELEEVAEEEQKTEETTDEDGRQKRQQQGRKQERSSVELPIDFTREYYTLV